MFHFTAVKTLSGTVTKAENHLLRNFLILSHFFSILALIPKSPDLAKKHEFRWLLFLSRK